MLENESQSIACDFVASQEFGTLYRRCAASHRVAGPYDAVFFLTSVARLVLLSPTWSKPGHMPLLKIDTEQIHCNKGTL